MFREELNSYMYKSPYEVLLEKSAFESPSFKVKLHAN